MSLALLRWLWMAQLRAQPGRMLAAAATIAIGVTLGLAIHLVNRSALDEFDAALAVVNGEAQARIEARGETLDEQLWPSVANAQGVAEASPVIDLAVTVAGAGALERLRLIGIDPMRAARITPDLVPSAQGAGAGIELFADDAIFLSAHALALAGLQVGDTLRIDTGDRRGGIELRIAGEVRRVAADVALAVMDIGTLQWRLGWAGRLSRIDLRLTSGVSPASLAASGALTLPDDALLVTPDAARQRMSNLSRAYRVNLNVLALVALFTGVFIVHAAMSLAVAREQAQLALLGVLGAPPRLRLVQMLGLGLLPGAAGSLAGIAGGVAAARLLLDLTGGDLGGGYFSGKTLSLSLPPTSLIGFGLAGVAAAALGSAAAAWRAARLAPARALRAGRSGALDESGHAGLSAGVVLALFVIGAVLLAVPAIDGLPIPAYATIAVWLVAGIGMLPHLLRRLGPLLRDDRLASFGPLAWLAAQRVSQTPGSVSAALAGIVAAIALASAMAIMVTSFRVSVGQWLDNVLPADLYGRLEASGPGASLDTATRERIARLLGVERVEFLHVTRLTLDPARPPVTLLARPLDARAPQARLPLTGLSLPIPAGEVPIWVSEAVVDLQGWRPGMQIDLPVPGAGSRHFFVAGVWRDYARQHGAIAIDLADWESIVGHAPITEFGLWIETGAGNAATIEQLETIAGDDRKISVRSAAALRELSLRIFDRSFAATWALEAVAVIVALFGIASAWSAEAISRRREFGMLRHLGLTPAAIARQFALEAGILVSAAVCWGVALGAVIAMVLVQRVNPQSFHWTMDMAWPLGPMLAAGIAMIALSAVVAALAGRQAGNASPIRAVREDW